VTATIQKQCPTCPWRVDCVPEQDIPHGYTCELHEALRDTIATDPISSLRPGPLRIMACHYSTPGHEIPCAGWLYNQMGPGNNLAVRMALMDGKLPMPEVDGPQHPTFDDTLPRRATA
jgi:Family of unknown function (DUF6283)